MALGLTGGQDPYRRLKAALRADINAEAWESLYDYGDEVMKGFTLP